MIDHVTIHVPPGTLDSVNLTDFFWMLGMAEVAADDEYEHGWKVRWWALFTNGDARKPYIHLVETDDGEFDFVSLGHFCVRVDARRMGEIRHTAGRREWLGRDSGSGRVWVRFNNIRVEVRP